MTNLYNFPNASLGFDKALVDVVRAVPIFTPMLLIFVFVTVLLSGMISQYKRTGTSDFLVWFSSAMFSTLMVSLPLKLIFGLISNDVFGLVVILTILAVSLLFFNYKRAEL